MRTTARPGGPLVSASSSFAFSPKVNDASPGQAGVLVEPVHDIANPVGQRHPGCPPDRGLETAYVGTKIARLNSCLGFRPLDMRNLSAPGDLDDQSGQLGERGPLARTDVVRRIQCRRRDGDLEHGVDHIVDVDVVAQLASLSEDGDGLAPDRLVDELVDHAVAALLWTLKRAIRVGDAQDDAVETVFAPVDAQVAFRRKL